MAEEAQLGRVHIEEVKVVSMDGDEVAGSNVILNSMIRIQTKDIPTMNIINQYEEVGEATMISPKEDKEEISNKKTSLKFKQDNSLVVTRKSIFPFMKIHPVVEMEAEAEEVTTPRTTMIDDRSQSNSNTMIDNLQGNKTHHTMDNSASVNLTMLHNTIKKNISNQTENQQYSNSHVQCADEVEEVMVAHNRTNSKKIKDERVKEVGAIEIYA